jgi:phenylalanyl-tRNA synthetase beta subunit
VGKNMKEGVKQPKIFELNSFFTIDDGLVKEEKELQAIYVGEDPYFLTSVAREVWNKTSRKNVAEYKNLGIAQNIGRGFWYETHEKNEPWISVSEVSNSVKKKFEIPLNKKVWSINLLLSYWDGTYFDHKRYKDESMFPITKRSYTVVLDKSRMWSEVVQVVQAVPTRDFEIVISPIERFEKGEKDTLTFEVQYISYSKTLTKEEIEEFEKKMVQELDHAG